MLGPLRGDACSVWKSVRVEQTVRGKVCDKVQPRKMSKLPLNTYRALSGEVEERTHFGASPRPHRGPLPSDGRRRIVLRWSAHPTAVESARDGSGCSLSRRTGEGQGEGHFIRNTPPGRHLFLHKPKENRFPGAADHHPG